jgi:hypothetical protein
MRKEKEKELSKQKMYLKSKLLRKTGVRVDDAATTTVKKDPFARDREKFAEKQRHREDAEQQRQEAKHNAKERVKERAIRGKKIEKMRTKGGQVNLNLKVKDLLKEITKRQAKP